MMVVCMPQSHILFEECMSSSGVVKHQGLEILGSIIC